jgi:hypothetical protein
MKLYHDIKNVRFDEEKLYININGKEYSFLLESISEKLSKSSKEELEQYTISPSGYGIHWDIIDEDLSIDGLLGIKHQSKIVQQLAGSH